MGAGGAGANGMKDAVLEFKQQLKGFAERLQAYVADPGGQWKVRGFIDILKNIYTISTDTKILSKILEIQIFPALAEFSHENGYCMELASKQNYYPDVTFISRKDDRIKFAVDVKTTYRIDENTCNGFTLGSHGEYFVNRSSRKNIQYPYGEYIVHFCLGIIYDRGSQQVDETKVYPLESLETIPAVASNFLFFVAEKWKIASDKGGSGNTANIGSIKTIADLINEQGIFVPYGEKVFDDYWMNFGKITIPDGPRDTRKITSLPDFLAYKNQH